ncbi:peptidoglycan-binding protein [Alteribacter natronophilus]|uniref:peptidoglycan-binding protein n=1 Tax=Alteribacter natronophilus TaxID=2583810 RepID=UPI00110D6670|nr:peptidoglycan-binding protein [Alteribacter natronophilus]TMW73394.1 peptidoglycan-binding protein [Alteribacter natronophilus]
MTLNRLRTKWFVCLFAAFSIFMIAGPHQADASNVLGDNLLKQGVENEETAYLQELLNKRGYIEEVNGVFDKTTAEAVKAFQGDASIKVDGVAGPQTLGALQVLRQGDRGDAVLALQEDLKQLGYYNGKLDGVFGPVTHRSITDFQREQGILTDGLAGPQTYGKIHGRLQGAQETAVASASSGSESAGTTEEESNGSESSADEESTPSSSRSSASSDSGENSSTDSVSEPASASGSDSESASESTSRSGSASEPEGRTFTVEATAYTAYCNGCSGITFTGLDLRSNPDKKVIAVDPSVIPLGSQVHVEGYGTFLAADIGGAIKGNRIDIFMPDRSDALAFGRRDVAVTVID